MVIVLLVAFVLPSLGREDGRLAATSPGQAEPSVPAAVATPRDAQRRTPVPLPTVRPEFADQTFATLASYRFDVVVEASGRTSPMTPLDGEIRVTGIVITDPVEAMEIEMTGHQADVTMRLRMIEDRAWVSYGDGFIPVDPAELLGIRQAFESYRPENLFGQFMGQMPTDAEATGEGSVGGRATATYRIPSQITPIPGVVAGVRMEATYELDVELGLPLFMLVDVTHADAATEGFFRVQVELTGLNDPDNVLVDPGQPSS